jgi:sortase A
MVPPALGAEGMSDVTDQTAELAHIEPESYVGSREPDVDAQPAPAEEVVAALQYEYQGVPRRHRDTGRLLRQIAIGTVIGLLALIAAFVAFELWVTPMLQSRNQSALLTQFKRSLVLDDTPQLVTPPNGQPVGVIEIPDIGVEQVIVQGISSDDTKLGPGHDPTTPAPGQAGNAVVVGRSTTYGAPFSRIAELQPGRPIYVVTRQGKFTYLIVSHRNATFGTPSIRTAPSGASLLTLVTADTGNNPVRPTGENVVVARLAGPGLQAPGPLPLPAPGTRPGQTQLLSGWQWILLWGQLLIVTAIGAWYLYRRGWSASVTYLLTTPLILAFAFLFFGSVDSLLPPTF